MIVSVQEGTGVAISSRPAINLSRGSGAYEGVSTSNTPKEPRRAKYSVLSFEVKASQREIVVYESVDLGCMTSEATIGLSDLVPR